MDFIKNHYPNCVNFRDFIVSYFHELKETHDISISDITYGTSSCSDGLNRSIDNLNILGSKFILGGIGGFPHTGTTGMAAYFSHISDNGAAFILFGSHIGITDDGELGKVLRSNQSKISNSCGALVIALDRFQNDKNYHPNLNNHHDFQQMVLESKLVEFKDRFLNSDNPIKEITDVAYEIIEREIYDLVYTCRNDFNSKKIALLGGVKINTSKYFNDYIDVRKIDVITF